jgi:membrane protease subunit (stomatin/prohibitin family)
MASDDQGPCFIVIGIVIIAMSFIIWWNLFIFIMGVGFIMGGICLSQQKVKRDTAASQTSTNQAQPAVQQTAPAAPAPAPAPPQPVIEPEKAKFCPHCGSPANENFCEACGAKID